MAKRTKRGREGRRERRPTEEAAEEGPDFGVALPLGGAGVVLAILGFWLVSQGSITAAPILLVIAYLVLIPLALVR